MLFDRFVKPQFLTLVHMLYVFISMRGHGGNRTLRVIGSAVIF